nr:DUF1501 domain-containing protein [Verrucomicrobium spinosum]
MNLRTCSNTVLAHTRRAFLQQTSAGFGWLALAAMAGQKTYGQQPGEQATRYVNPLAPKTPHFPAKAKRVIFLYMQGGPSHMETFDWKPEMVGKEGGNHALLGPVLKFHPSGQSGLMISEAFPELAKHADDLCLLNGCQTRTPSHSQATVALHTGNDMFVRPPWDRGRCTVWARRRRICGIHHHRSSARSGWGDELWLGVSASDVPRHAHSDRSAGAAQSGPASFHVGATQAGGLCAEAEPSSAAAA